MRGREEGLDIVREKPVIWWLASSLVPVIRGGGWWCWCWFASEDCESSMAGPSGAGRARAGTWARNMKLDGISRGSDG